MAELDLVAVRAALAQGYNIRSDEARALVAEVERLRVELGAAQDALAAVLFSIANGLTLPETVAVLAGRTATGGAGS